MTRVLVTGAVQGLGRAAADALHADGHQLVLHARTGRRAQELEPLTAAGAEVVTGDLGSVDGALGVADQVRGVGPVDVVIHNAGVYADDAPHRDRAGHPRTLCVNTFAPYLLTALLPPPRRLVVVTSDMYTSGAASLDDLDWTRRRWNGTRAYCDSKLLVTALVLWLQRRRPGVVSSAVDPGWVPTRMAARTRPTTSSRATRPRSGSRRPKKLPPVKEARSGITASLSRRHHASPRPTSRNAWSNGSPA